MAGLPPDGTWAIQDIEGTVSVFNRDTDDEVINFDPADTESFCNALKVIWFTDKLTDEQKSFASFWTGYFYAHHSGEEVG